MLCNYLSLVLKIEQQSRPNLYLYNSTSLFQAVHNYSPHLCLWLLLCYHLSHTSFVIAVVHWLDYNLCKQEEQRKGDFYLVILILPPCNLINSRYWQHFWEFCCWYTIFRNNQIGYGNTCQKWVYSSQITIHCYLRKQILIFNNKCSNMF